MLISRCRSAAASRAGADWHHHVLRTEKLVKTYAGARFFQKARVKRRSTSISRSAGRDLGHRRRVGLGKSTVARAVAPA